MALKTFFLISLAALSLPPFAPVDWQTPTSIDMGDLQHNEPSTFVFSYTNTGDQPLLVDNVRTSCGCTSPDWEEISVAPGDTGQIIIEYDANDLGYFKKWIKVYFNGYRRAEKLYIEGFVEG